MKPRWPGTTSAFAAVLAVSAVVRTSAANVPPPTFCEVKPGQCHPMVGRTRAHFLGMMQQVIRAVPKAPGYRCRVEQKYIDDVGYGRSARHAAPDKLYEVIACFHRGTDPRKRMPDVAITVQLSMLPADISEEKERDKQQDLLVFANAKSVAWVFGKVREWRDPGGVVHRGYAPSNAIARARAAEVVDNGPYLVSAQVSIGAQSPEALDAFVRGFDRAAISALMGREEQRRRADPGGVRPIAGALP